MTASFLSIRRSVQFYGVCVGKFVLAHALVQEVTAVVI